jgi:hypothetical protein
MEVIKIFMPMDNLLLKENFRKEKKTAFSLPFTQMEHYKPR